MKHSAEFAPSNKKNPPVQKEAPPIPVGWQDFFAIPDLGISPNVNSIASNGLATIVGGFSNMNLGLFVQNNKSKDIVAAGSANSFTSELLTVDTQPTGAATTDRDVTAFMHYSYANAGARDLEADADVAAALSAGVVKRSAQSGVTADPKVTAPVRRSDHPVHPDAINIGLGRLWPDQGKNSQFDYAWSEDPKAHPVGKVPFSGHVTFGVPIRAPLQPKSGLILVIHLADRTGGGVSPQLPAQQMDHVYSKFSISPSDPKTLVWDLPPGVTTHDPGDPLVFGNVPWPSDIDAYFYCGITVVLSDGSLGFASVQSKTTPDTDTVDGTTEIMPVSFIWHCLGEDTSVLMEDGTERPIAEILAGDRVRLDASGAAATVQWTNKGIHKGEIVAFGTDGGQLLTASGNHVIMTRHGPIPASELTIGTEVETMEGFATITVLDHHTAYDGMMYNLATTTFESETDFDGTIGTFVANSLIVGDVNAQKAARRARRANVDWVKSQVPPFLWTDVDTYFAYKAQA